MNKEIRTIWQEGINIGLNLNESDAHDIFLALKKHREANASLEARAFVQSQRNRTITQWENGPCAFSFGEVAELLDQFASRRPQLIKSIPEVDKLLEDRIKEMGKLKLDKFGIYDLASLTAFNQLLIMKSLNRIIKHIKL